MRAHINKHKKAHIAKHTHTHVHIQTNTRRRTQTQARGPRAYPRLLGVVNGEIVGIVAAAAGAEVVDPAAARVATPVLLHIRIVALAPQRPRVRPVRTPSTNICTCNLCTHNIHTCTHTQGHTRTHTHTQGHTRTQGVCARCCVQWSSQRWGCRRCGRASRPATPRAPPGPPAARARHRSGHSRPAAAPMHPHRDAHTDRVRERERGDERARERATKSVCE
jgi:hypothetical protein